MYQHERLYKFDGPFADLCQSYIQQNRVLGYKYVINETYLRQFDHFCIGKAAQGDPITKGLFVEWTAKRAYESDTTFQMRYDVLARFCRSLVDSGSEMCLNFYPSPRNKSKTDFAPHIFSRDEITRIFAVVDLLTPRKHSPCLHWILPVLMRLLYSSGLRISEVLNLRVEDVDLCVGTLAIRDAKFDKSRKIPLSASMLTICRDYADKMQAVLDEAGFFFPSPDGGQYASCTIYNHYRDILSGAGIVHGGRGNGPRLHDLRHTFAVHSLRNLADKGVDLYVTLPILSNYMGHRSFVATQQYLRLTPEVYPELTKAFDDCFSSVFPEVVK